MVMRLVSELPLASHLAWPTFSLTHQAQGFSDSSVVKTPPANARRQKRLRFDP